MCNDIEVMFLYAKMSHRNIHLFLHFLALKLLEVLILVFVDELNHEFIIARYYPFINTWHFLMWMQDSLLL